MGGVCQHTGTGCRGVQLGMGESTVTVVRPRLDPQSLSRLGNPSTGRGGCGGTVGESSFPDSELRGLLETWTTHRTPHPNCVTLTRLYSQSPLFFFVNKLCTVSQRWGVVLSDCLTRPLSDGV